MGRGRSDAYGNLSSYSGPGESVSICIDSQKNRIAETQGSGCALVAEQDDFGNVTRFQGFNYEYDALDMLIHRKPVPPPLKKPQGATVEPQHTYVYTAADERIWQIRASGPLPPPDENDPGGPEYTSAPERITVRDLTGKVLRQYDKQTAYEFEPPDDVYAFPFTGTRDYIHRNGQLAATQTGTWWITHQHLDHLGTPRAISDGSGALVATHKYAPYGKEIGGSTGNALQFTGHERDVHGPGEDDNLDYMHARHYSVHLGRFLSVDRVDGSAGAPQSWNRYTYARGNPVKLVDPDGRDVFLAFRSANETAFRHAFIVIVPTKSSALASFQRASPRTGLLTLGGNVDFMPGKGLALVGRENERADERSIAEGRAQVIRVNAPDGQTTAQLEQNIIEAFDSYEPGAIKYSNTDSDFHGKNSNALASGMLRAAGVKDDRILKAGGLLKGSPGFRDPITLPPPPKDDELEREKERK